MLRCRSGYHVSQTVQKIDGKVVADIAAKDFNNYNVLWRQLRIIRSSSAISVHKAAAEEVYPVLLHNSRLHYKRLEALPECMTISSLIARLPTFSTTEDLCCW